MRSGTLVVGKGLLAAMLASSGVRKDVGNRRDDIDMIVGSNFSVIGDRARCEP